MLKTSARKPRAGQASPSNSADWSRPIPRSASPMRTEPDAAPRSGGAGAMLLGLCIVVLAGALYGVSAQANYLLGQLAAAIAGPLTLLGLWRGAFRKVLMLGGFVAGCYVFMRLQAPSAGAVGPANPPVGVSAGSMMALLAIPVLLILAALAGRFFYAAYFARRPFARTCDRFFGTLVGLAEAAMVILPLCWITTMILPAAFRVRDSAPGGPDSTQTRFAAAIVQLGLEASSGPVGEVTRATNLIATFPVLKQMIDDLNQTGRMDFGRLELDPALLQKLQELLPSTGAPGGTSILEQIRQQTEAHNAAARGASGQH